MGRLGKQGVYISFRSSDEPADQLKRLAFTVADLVDLSFVEGENLRIRVCQQDWGMRRDENLDVVVVGQQIMKQN
ncbi:MAG: hypothetical protein WA193_16445, partial [Candidatus Acidiferrales bacterium]